MISAIAVILACNTPTATAQPTATIESIITVSGVATEISTEVSIQHIIIPANLPENRSSHAGDHDSSTSVAIKQASGVDRFTFGKFEVPFNANTRDVFCITLVCLVQFAF